MLAVELGGLTALTRLQHLSKVDVDMQWYGVIDEAAAAALEQLRRTVAASAAGAPSGSAVAAVDYGAIASRGRAEEGVAVGAVAAVDSQQG
jgi:hypothetical protein